MAVVEVQLTHRDKKLEVAYFHIAFGGTEVIESGHIVERRGEAVFVVLVAQCPSARTAVEDCLHANQAPLGFG